MYICTFVYLNLIWRSDINAYCIRIVQLNANFFWEYTNKTSKVNPSGKLFNYLFS